MPRLPVVSGRETIRALTRAGFEVDRQRGSHVVLRKVDPPNRRIVAPDHTELARGTLRAILRQAGFTVEQILDLL